MSSRCLLTRSRSYVLEVTYRGGFQVFRGCKRRYSTDDVQQCLIFSWSKHQNKVSSLAIHTSSSSRNRSAAVVVPTGSSSGINTSSSTGRRKHHNQQQRYHYSYSDQHHHSNQLRKFTSGPSTSDNNKKNDDQDKLVPKEGRAIPKTFETRQGEDNVEDDDDDNDDHHNQDVVANWMQQVTSIPNIITLSRIASTPILAYWIITHNTDKALLGCAVAALSDVADGYIARNYNMSTTLGTYLDPLADKILINVLSISLWINGTLPTPLVALWFARDIGLMVGTYYHVKQNTKAGFAVIDPVTTPLQVNPTTISKINTGLQFTTLSVGICMEPLSTIIMPSSGDAEMVMSGLCWLTGGTTIASGFSYLGHSAFSDSGNTKQKIKKSVAELKQTVADMKHVKSTRELKVSVDDIKNSVKGIKSLKEEQIKSNIVQVKESVAEIKEMSAQDIKMSVATIKESVNDIKKSKKVQLETKVTKVKESVAELKDSVNELKNMKEEQLKNTVAEMKESATKLKDKVI